VQADSGQPRVSVVIPTYREAENLGELVPRIDAAVDGVEIVVVDDDSPDDTAAVCERLAREHPLRLLVRHGERGLASAVLHGFRESRGEVLVCMDADLSHAPEAIPALLEALAEGDFAVGSRYAHGGSTDEVWSLFRRLNSRVATVLARPLTPVRDPMAGFFALRRETFESASELDPVGYKIGLELLVKCGCRDVREVPITFRDRTRGESKLSLRQQWNYLVHLRRLYAFRHGHLLAAATDLLAFALILPLLPAGAARAVAVLLGAAWTFRRAPIATSAAALANWIVSTGLIARAAFFGEWKLAAAACGIATGLAVTLPFSERRRSGSSL